MTNVICVKVGDMYDAQYVNRLLKMCRACITEPFTFFCYTDDKSGIDTDVVCIDLIDNKITTAVFNKLFLLSDQFAQYISNDKCIFFDLDTVIQKSVDCLFENWTNNLRVIHASWKNSYFEEIGSPHFVHNINSSCMTWQPYHTNHYWQKFIENREQFLQQYTGMDQFLYFTMQVRGSLPDIFHSYKYGFTDGVNSKLFAKYFNHERQAFFFTGSDNPLTHYPVCLFNGDTTDEDYLRTYRRFYTD